MCAVMAIALRSRYLPGENMKPALSGAFAALLLPLASPAQTSDPADPASAVPPVHYSSALTPGKAEVRAPTPDQLWRQANDKLRDGGTKDTSPMSMPSSDDANNHRMHHHHHEE
jgi:hypothetical protein